MTQPVLNKQANMQRRLDTMGYFHRISQNFIHTETGFQGDEVVCGL